MLGDSTEQASNKQAIAAYEEAKRLHDAALDAFNARSKVGSSQSRAFCAAAALQVRRVVVLTVSFRN
jgi:hypothetical protein